MRILKIYLDTTIPNYAFNEHVPDKRMATLELFKNIKAGKYESHISDVVLRELNNTPDLVKKDKLINLVKEMIVLEVNDECIELAQEYITRKLIPGENEDDALHIAIATIYELDLLVSYNFEHIVKIRTIDGINAVNLLAGYKTLRIVIPEEVLDV